MLQSWAYKFFISLAVATVLALYAAYPRPARTHHKTTDAQTPAPSATSSPVPHVSDLPDSPQLGHPDLAPSRAADRHQPRPGHRHDNC